MRSGGERWRVGPCSSSGIRMTNGLSNALHTVARESLAEGGLVPKDAGLLAQFEQAVDPAGEREESVTLHGLASDTGSRPFSSKAHSITSVGTSVQLRGSTCEDSRGLVEGDDQPLHKVLADVVDVVGKRLHQRYQWRPSALSAEDEPGTVEAEVAVSALSSNRHEHPSVC